MNNHEISWENVPHCKAIAFLRDALTSLLHAVDEVPNEHKQTQILDVIEGVIERQKSQAKAEVDAARQRFESDVNQAQRAFEEAKAELHAALQSFETSAMQRILGAPDPRLGFNRNANGEQDPSLGHVANNLWEVSKLAIHYKTSLFPDIEKIISDLRKDASCTKVEGKLSDGSLDQ